MSKQTAHKVSAIILVLTVFGVPFYIEREQISSLNNNAYLVGAVVNNRTISQSTKPQDNLTSSQMNEGATVVGNSFVGVRAQ